MPSKRAVFIFWRRYYVRFLPSKFPLVEPYIYLTQLMNWDVDFVDDESYRKRW